MTKTHRKPTIVEILKGLHMTAREFSEDGVSKIVLKSGQIRFEARINRSGEKSIQKRFTKKSTAIAWREEQLKTLARGAPITNGKKFTIDSVIDEYLAYRDTTSPMSGNQRTDFTKVKSDLGNRIVSTLEKQTIEEWLTLLKKSPKGYYKDGREMTPYAEATRRRFFFSLVQSVRWHQEKHEYYIKPDLFKINKKIMPKAWEGHRERRFEEGEEQALYAAGLTRKGSYTRQDWEAIIGFALETAMREQEITLAKFSDIRNHGFDLIIPKLNSKTKIKRTIFLSTKARQIIASQKQTCPAGEDRIFHQFPSADAVCEAFISLRKRAKVKNFRFHDLRHEATSRMCEDESIKFEDILAMTGHKSLATFLGYMQMKNRSEELKKFLEEEECKKKI